MNKNFNEPGLSQDHGISESEIITFVVAPASEHASGLNLQGLVDLINKNSEFKIRIVFCKDYAEAMDALIKGKAKIGWLGPNAYHETSRNGSIEHFAIGLPKGKETFNYKSVFIVQKCSFINSLEMLENCCLDVVVACG